jgi:hypothetical protein
MTALYGEIDATHQDNKGRTHAQDQRDGRCVQKAYEIANGQEVGVEETYHDAKGDQHRHRREAAPPLAD